MGKWIPAAYYRGGTSKGVFFQKKDLPTNNQEQLRKFFLKVIGSPDPHKRQLNGMGGGISSLSKCVIVSPSQRKNADLDYNFIQLAVDKPIADWSGNCGNLSAAVGPFAVNQSMIKSQEGSNTIRIYQVNTRKIILATFNVDKGQAVSEGDYHLAGVSGTGAKIRLDFLSPSGSSTGKLLPTGNPQDEIRISLGRKIKVSLVDAATPLVYLRAEDLGLKGTEPPEKLDTQLETSELIEKVRRRCGVILKIAKSEGKVPLGSPRIGFVAPPQDYQSLNQSTIKASEQDITTRMFSMGKAHKTIMGTAEINLAVAVAIPGTIPYQVKRKKANPLELRIGNPSGVMTSGAEVRNKDMEVDVKSAVIYRTYRPLMVGKVFVG